MVRHLNSSFKHSDTLSDFYKSHFFQRNPIINGSVWSKPQTLNMNRITRCAMLAAATMMTAATAWAMPVEDITLKNVAPKAGDLDIELRSLEQITLTFDATEVILGENATASLACPDGTTATATLVRNSVLKNVVLLDFPDLMPYNGTYTLTIKKWSLGDEEWVDNPEAGHSNPNIEVVWNVTNGLERKH